MLRRRKIMRHYLNILYFIDDYRGGWYEVSILKNRKYILTHYEANKNGEVIIRRYSHSKKLPHYEDYEGKWWYNNKYYSSYEEYILSLLL